MSSEENRSGQDLLNYLIELRIKVHDGGISGKSMARKAYEEALMEAVSNKPDISWQDLDMALKRPYLQALKKRGL